MDNWRRTGQVGGMPISNEEEALQTAVKGGYGPTSAGSCRSDGRDGWGAPAMPSPTGDNPLLAALRGGVR